MSIAPVVLGFNCETP